MDEAVSLLTIRIEPTNMRQGEAESRSPALTPGVLRWRSTYCRAASGATVSSVDFRVPLRYIYAIRDTYLK